MQIEPAVVPATIIGQFVIPLRLNNLPAMDVIDLTRTQARTVLTDQLASLLPDVTSIASARVIMQMCDVARKMLSKYILPDYIKCHFVPKLVKGVLVLDLTLYVDDVESNEEISILHIDMHVENVSIADGLKVAHEVSMELSSDKRFTFKHERVLPEPFILTSFYELYTCTEVLGTFEELTHENLKGKDTLLVAKLLFDETTVIHIRYRLDIESYGVTYL